MRTRLLVPLVFTLLVPAAVSAQMQDRQLGERVAQTVRTYPHFTIFDDINISIDNRAVVLTGRVTTPVKKKELGERVEKIDGIRSLTNDIGVLPVSQSDQRLRVQLANAIYNHPAFWKYAQMSNPPIHIIVEHGRVTLTGSVGTDVDRALASSLAQIDGTLGVTNNLRVDGR